MSPIQVIYFTLRSARWTTWIRIFAEMFLGFTLANGLVHKHFGIFFLGFIIVGPLLWSAAYILNDITDISYDLRHISRRYRPIPQGLFPVNYAYRIALILIILSFILGILIHIIFLAGIIILLISQALYTLPPFRLKEKIFFDLFLNGINGGVRFILGFVTVNASVYQIPLLFLIFAICVKLILFVGHRMQSRDIEQKIQFKSTVASLTTHQISIMLGTLGLIAIVSYTMAIWYYSMKLTMLIPFILSGLLMLPVIPEIKKGYLTKQESTINLRVYLYIIMLLFSLSFYIVKII